jgi:hypothetical protein
MKTSHKLILMMSGVATVVPIPSANFSWVPFAVHKIGGVFQPAPGWALSSMIDQSGGDRYVGKGGNDTTGNGLTYATRWLTISKGLTDTPANGRVLVYAGKYGWSDGAPTASWPARNISLVGMEAGVYLDSYYTSSWSLTTDQTYTYQTAFAVGAPSFVFDYGTLLSDGAPTAYTLMTSIATVEAAAGSYWWSSDVLYVRPLEAGTPDADVRPSYAGGRCVTFGAGADNQKAYVENITCCGLSNLMGNASAAGGSASYFKTCKFFYPNVGIAFEFKGTDGILQDCHVAYKAAAVDLISGTALNTVICRIIEINCTVHDVGIATGTQSWNCTTNHGAGKNLIINGDYSRSYGRPIGFINDGECWMLGTYSHHSLATDGPGGSNANYQLDESLCYMDNCKGDNSTYGFTNAHAIYARNFVGDITDSGGGNATLTPY